jgi:hypothetical protein
MLHLNQEKEPLSGANKRLIGGYNMAGTTNVEL